MAPRITVVNDNPEFLELVRDILKDEHYAVTAIDGDLEGALDRIVDSRPDVLILDLRLGTDELHGWDIAQELRREPALEGLPVIICSADVLALQTLADDLDNTKQVRTLPKPFAIAELTAAIDGLLAEAKASPGESVGRNSRRAASSIMTSSASPSMSASSSFRIASARSRNRSISALSRGRDSTRYRTTIRRIVALTACDP